LHSGYWCASDGCITVIKKNGTIFRTTPTNIGVEGHLYTLFQNTDLETRNLEKWFSEEIDGPFVQTLRFLSCRNNIKSFRFRFADLNKVKAARQVGYSDSSIREHLVLDEDTRLSIAKYVSALLVRNPEYLEKMYRYIKNESDISGGSFLKYLSLENMQYLYNIYLDKIQNADYMLIIRDCKNEFIFSDGGVVAQEPWKDRLMPFDVHVPLTPDLSLTILPVAKPVYRNKLMIVKARAKIIKSLNKIVLGSAKKFVYTKSKPPVSFIMKHFGKPAPKVFGYREIDGKNEAKYFSERDN